MGESVKIDVEIVKKNILIPKYFEEIIIPEMAGYYSDYTVDFHNRPVAKCPIHGEDTPSFRWYEETNTFHCFGCRASGDVINLHRKFTATINGEEPSFKEAIQFLHNKFIKGLESVELVQHKQKEVEYKSTVAELLNLSNYIERLEKRLMRASNTQVNNKVEVYKAIDIIKTLSSLNKIGAKEGLVYLKNIVELHLR